MDLLTQAALGAILAQALVGGQTRRAPLLGAALGVLPDADTLLSPLLDELERLRFHRNLSHSLLACALLPPLLGSLLHRLGSRGRPPDEAGVSRGRWILLIGLVWLTHVLLDCCTTFGTQLWQPFSAEPVAWRIVSVIDPGVTLPLLLGLFLGWRLPERAKRCAWAGLAGACLYLALCCVAKAIVTQRSVEASILAGLDPQRTLSKPTLFNALLWRVVVEDEAGFWVGYTSLLDSGPLRYHRRVLRHEERWGPWAERVEARDLRRILAEAYTLEREPSGALLVSDLRYGQWAAWTSEETPYVFAYRLEEDEGRLRVTTPPRAGLSREQRQSYLRRVLGEGPN